MGRRHRARHRTGRHYATMTSVTGTHRAVGKRRGIAAWPIVCVVLVAFLVAGWFGWHWADGVLESRAAAQAADCKQGDLPLRVTVDPALEEPVMAAASRWNEERTVVREHCVRVVVHTASPDDVYAVLTDDADPTTIGGSPAAWLPDSTAPTAITRSSLSRAMTRPAPNNTPRSHFRSTCSNPSSKPNSARPV